MKKIFLFLSFAFFMGFSANAQMKITNTNVLTFGESARYKTYMTTWTGWAHAWVSGPTNPNVIKMFLTAADPRIGTNTNKLVIYDSEGMGFQDLHARTLYTYSDMTAKTNITSLRSGTALVAKLNPVSYNWKDGAEYEKFNTRGTSVSASKALAGNSELGFLAQELEQVLPGAVVMDAEGNRLINYSAVIPVLTAAIQELTQRVESLEAQVKSLQK